MITRAEIDLSHRYEEYWPAFLAVLNAARCFTDLYSNGMQSFDHQQIFITKNLSKFQLIDCSNL